MKRIKDIDNFLSNYPIGYPDSSDNDEQIHHDDHTDYTNRKGKERERVRRRNDDDEEEYDQLHLYSNDDVDHSDLFKDRGKVNLRDKVKCMSKKNSTAV